MKIQTSKYYKFTKDKIENILLDFKGKGEVFFQGPRNEIRTIELEGKLLNIKSFKKPNYFNRYVYVFLRPSKAERSFNYACKLLEKDIGTPKPVAFAEEVASGALVRSFYISEHLENDMTFREIDLAQAGHEKILRAFTRFTFSLHEKEVEFLDHSPGNTLIKLKEDSIEFYLVDLNRMNFRKLDFSERMKNFSRLSQNKGIFKVMANEYSRLIAQPEAEVFEKMWYYNRLFFEKRQQKRKVKKKFKNLVGLK
ncbi:lipopolysaccharide kinase InaA family protein [Salinimicrobium terrae]|uniref:lipopolysaccharide kinase InaA family protein n=1 Tax=Salinimicrobium terrae TaxID=470866 RepID=UPI0004276A2D|nr:lipopolysaccharide kinase InaA family protein [Salinimicrobium terrae]